MKSPLHWALVGLLLSFASCSETPIGKTEEEEAARQALDTVPELPEIGNFPSTAYAFDMKVKAETPEQDRTLKASMRLKPDSLIWGSVAPAFGIELGRVLLGNDTLFFMDRMNDRYYRGIPEKMSDRFGIPMDRELLESILFARPAILYSEGFSVWKAGRDTLHYRPMMDEELEKRLGIKGMSDPYDSLQPERLATENGASYHANDSNERFLPFYWASDSSHTITRFTAIDLQQRSILDIRYQAYGTMVDSSRIPTEMKLRVRSPKGISTFEIGVDGIEPSDSLNYPFSIPDGYAPIRP